MGPPGSGKNERGKIIRAKFRGRSVPFRRVVCSTLLKRIEKTDPEYFRREIKPYIERGELVPDYLVIRVILKYIEPMLKAGFHILVDGFPRTEEQARASETLLHEARKTHRIVTLILDTPMAICEIRVLGPNGRRRSDDTKENFARRKITWKKSVQGARHLKSVGILVRKVRAGRNPSEGVRHILAILGLN